MFEFVESSNILPPYQGVWRVCSLCLPQLILLTASQETCFFLSPVEAGVLAKTYIDKDLLVPDCVMTCLLLPRLEQMTRYSWVLDGKRVMCLA